jgi:hypothetical protein
LSDALSKTFPPSIYNGFRKADPQYVRETIALGFMDSTSAFAAAASDPDLVTVDIEAHPVQ